MMLEPAVEPACRLLLGGPVLEPVLQTLAWIVALTLVFAPLAIRQYRRLP
jgi:hypothetical protein